MDPRVGAHDLHGAAGVGVHRSDVHLVAVAAGRRRAVVADRDRQEVEHQVGIHDVLVAPYEASGLEVIGRAEAGPEEQPFGADERLAPVLQPRRHRDGLGARVLDVHLQVVLEMLSHAGKVLHDRDAEGLELTRAADARQLQGLGRAERAAAEDHLAGGDAARPGPVRVVHAHRAGSLEQDPVHHHAGADLEVRTARHGMEVRAGRRQSPPPMHVAVERCEPPAGSR